MALSAHLWTVPSANGIGPVGLCSWPMIDWLLSLPVAHSRHALDPNERLALWLDGPNGCVGSDGPC